MNSSEFIHRRWSTRTRRAQGNVPPNADSEIVRKATKIWRRLGVTSIPWAHQAPGAMIKGAPVIGLCGSLTGFSGRDKPVIVSVHVRKTDLNAPPPSAAELTQGL
jgi:hypothetical protein